MARIRADGGVTNGHALTLTKYGTKMTSMVGLGARSEGSINTPVKPNLRSTGIQSGR